jgi:hypothetical protein
MLNEMAGQMLAVNAHQYTPGSPRKASASAYRAWLHAYEEERAEFTTELYMYLSWLLTETSPADPRVRDAAEKLVKEGCDMILTAAGVLATLGVDIDEALRRVHASNMTKTPSCVGKPIKGPAYEPAFLTDLVLVEPTPEPATETAIAPQ